MFIILSYFPTCQVRASRFCQSYFPPLPDLNSELQISVGTLDPNHGELQISVALLDLKCELRISVGTTH